MFSLLPYFARSDLKYMEQDGTNIDGDFSVAYLTMMQLAQSEGKRKSNTSKAHHSFVLSIQNRKCENSRCRFCGGLFLGREEVQ